jgi:hypothetical protein
MNSYRPSLRRDTSSALVRAAGRLCAFGLFAFPALAAFPNGYTYCKVVTTLHTMVSGANDLANFPLTVVLTDADLRTTANGGLVNNSSGYDIGFGPDCSGTGTMLKWEMESYTPAAGSIVAHVLRPTLSHTTDDTVGMYFGGAFASFQSTPSAVWNTNYKQICHLGDGTTVSNVCSVGNNLTLIATPSAAAGAVSGAAAFDGAAQAASVPVDLSATATITLECWLNWTAFTNLDNGLMAEFTTTVSNAGSFFADPNATGGKFRFGMGSGVTYWLDDFPRPSAGSWHHIALVMNRSTNSNTAYVDGVSQSLTPVVHSPQSGNYVNSVLYLMSRAASTLFGKGSFDELRISDTARTSDWILTEYRNQSAPATYTTAGPRIGSSTAVRHRVINM